MAVLASYTNKQTSAVGGEAEVTIPATGKVQFLVYGNIGGTGVVYLRLKTADGNFTRFKELTLYGPDGGSFQVDLILGDKVKVEFRGCTAASAEVRQ